MALRRRHFAAVSLGVYLVAEILLSALAIGHHHAPVDSSGAKAIGTCCTHHHSHTCPDSSTAADADVSPSSSPAPTEEECSICRSLAEVAVPVTFVPIAFSRELSEPIFHVVSFDVATPSYLLPLPRSPPATV